MSETILLTGRSNVLECVFAPPVLLDSHKSHYIGLVEFVAYNSIPNVNHTNQIFRYANQDGTEMQIRIPRGAYEIDAIQLFLKNELGADAIELRGNKNTLKCELRCKYAVDFRGSGSIGPMLGFEQGVYAPNVWHTSQQPVNITSVNVICIECNLATGSYVNGGVAHTIFAFSPLVPPGYKMALSPRNIIYNRINTIMVDRLQISIVDQDGRPVDFAGEQVSVRLHIKSVNE